MSQRQAEFQGGILAVRAVEDCIRVTKKYTEGIGTMRTKHPIQGEDFASKVFCKYYEVYPDVDTSCMSFGTIVEWLTGYSTHIDVVFRYDYREDKATISIKDGGKAIQELARGIPNFRAVLTRLEANGSRRA